MKVAFLSRKNLIAMGIAILFAFNFIVIGVLTCIMPEFNDIVYGLGFDILETSLIAPAEVIGVVITGVFLFLLVFGIIFVSRLSRINGHKFFSKKNILFEVIYILAWFVILFLLNLLVELFDFSLFADLFFIEMVTLLLSAAVSLIVAIPLGAIIMIIVSFVNMGKPYAFFSKESMPDFGDEDEETIVSKSFEEKENENGK